MNFLDPRLPRRFWDKCIPEPMSGCWLWFACTSPQGYGRVGTGGHTTEYAHRLAYLTLVGPIPEGLELDHKCTVRCCCNPAHLEPVTHAENNRRSTAGAVNVGATTLHAPIAPGMGPMPTGMRFEMPAKEQA